MKQLARSMAWGIGVMALVQLPVQLPGLASSPMPTATPDNQTAQSGRQLLAIAITSRSLRPNEQSADVRALQRYLARNGLYPYAIDGFYGQDTVDAVATYQRIRDLPATGVANEETLRDMGFDFLPAASASSVTQAASAQPTLSVGGLAAGSTGSDVTALQRRLNSLGIPVLVDGNYGFETQQAIRTYQRVQGLPVTGNADRDTLKALGFSAPSYPYIAAVIADESQLARVRQFFPDAFVDRNQRGRFINIGSFGDRFPAEARVDAAAARGFNTRVLYR
ncbi:MAG: peptidoglycan-binding domain-containing protein [Phormidesmis sp.]